MILPAADDGRFSNGVALTDSVGGPCDAGCVEEKYCPTCGVDQWVEQPPDDEPDRCQEWICVECSTAFIDGWLHVGLEIEQSATSA